MFNFSRLVNRTPAQIEQDRIDVLAQQEALDRLEMERIATRSAQVVALHEGNYPFDAFEARFIDRLHYRTTTFDTMGREGGRLAELSDKQLDILDRLVRVHLSVPAAGFGLDSEAPPRP